jgi:hypothetical protein
MGVWDGTTLGGYFSSAMFWSDQKHAHLIRNK